MYAGERNVYVVAKICFRVELCPSSFPDNVMCSVIHDSE